MARGAAAALLLLAASAPAGALRAQSPAQPEAASPSAGGEQVDKRPAVVEIVPPPSAVLPWSGEWTYMPAEPKLGIVTGGPWGFYEQGYGNQTAEMLLEYAKRTHIALYIDKNTSRMSTRHHSWNKIMMLYKFMKDVPYIAWIDPDLVVYTWEKPLAVEYRKTPCDGVGQTRWKGYLPKAMSNATWLWLPASNRGGGPDQYYFNAETSMMIVKNCPEAHTFLEQVWNRGYDEHLVERHANASIGQPEGFPFEQASIWELLAENPKKYMASTCVAPYGTLTDLPTDFLKPAFAMHTKTLPKLARNALFYSIRDAMRKKPVF